jgi:hypothetical protein
VSDVWINPGTQFDGGSISGVFLASAGAGSLIEDVHLDHVYIDGAVDMVTASAGASSNIQNLWVSGCWLSQATGRAVVVGGLGLTTGLHVSGNAIDSCTSAASGAITISNVTGAEITNNVLTRSVTQTCIYVATLGTGCNYLNCTGNVSSGITTSGVIQDLSGGITKVVANNI